MAVLAAYCIELFRRLSNVSNVSCSVCPTVEAASKAQVVMETAGARRSERKVAEGSRKNAE